MANCATCDHKLNPQGGHCYMFEREPEDCRRHTQGLSAGAIGSVRHNRGSSLLHALMVLADQQKGSE